MTDIETRFNLLVETHKLGRILYSIIRKDKELLDWINSKITESTQLPEQLYCIINNLSPVCENGNKKFFKDSWAGYYRCGRDSCKCWQENQSKKLTIAKNLLSTDQWNDIIEKRKTTNLIKYGKEFAVQNKEIQEKITATNIEKYGVKTTLLVPSVQEKIRESIFGKYGVDNPMKINSIKQRAMDTCLEKYGHKIYTHSKEGRDIVRKTLKEKYNVSSIAQLKFSQPVRDLLQDITRFHKEYQEIGINGLCGRYPELNYNMIRAKLIREGVVDVIHFTKPESFIKDFLDNHNIKYQLNHNSNIRQTISKPPTTPL